jgi:2-keto-4-pentenoate hydratase/2-oxohepta-3-ene-1,7-dioic acid hydratase in catechol pathway
MVESGMDPDAKLFNMFFTKADASVCSGDEKVTRPSHVKLLDYEIELALVFRRPISSTVTRETLPDYVFGITIANDLSARDVQLPQTQFFKGKSYRGFCPIGPWLTVLEREEFPRIDDLALELDVNGAPRQRDTTANLVFKPPRLSPSCRPSRHRSRRRALDRHAERLALRCRRRQCAGCPGAAGARAVEAVPQRTGASAAIS